MSRKKFIVSEIILILFCTGCITTGSSTGIMPDTTLRDIYLQSHPGLDDITKNDIENRTIRVGMTIDQVKASWGYPDEIYNKEEDDFIRYTYKESAPETIFGHRRDIYLFFDKPSLSGGIESHLVGWYPPDMEYGVIKIEDAEESLIDWEEVDKYTQ